MSSRMSRPRVQARSSAGPPPAPSFIRAWCGLVLRPRFRGLFRRLERGPHCIRLARVGRGRMFFFLPCRSAPLHSAVLSVHLLSPSLVVTVDRQTDTLRSHNRVYNLFFYYGGGYYEDRLRHAASPRGEARRGRGRPEQSARREACAKPAAGTAVRTHSGCILMLLS
jgi:hypothetical protein